MPARPEAGEKKRGFALGIAPLAEDPDNRPRLAVIDLARGVAIIAMVVYHTAFDLSAGGLIATDVESDLGWKLLARLTAGSFLVLVGIGLVLATRNGFNRRAYLRRLGLIAGGAALVSLATWWFNPSTFVFFGILHEIAVASVLALPFLALPTWLVATAAAVIVAAPWFLANPFFDQPALWWLGLSTEPPVTVDYVPLFPWFGIVLAGLVAGGAIVRNTGTLARFHPSDALSRALIQAGRWSLAIYLIHQPIIVGALHLFATVTPQGQAIVRHGIVGRCALACTDSGPSLDTCTALCSCMFDGLYGTDLFDKPVAAMTPEQQQRWDGIADHCRTPP